MRQTLSKAVNEIDPLTFGEHDLTWKRYGYRQSRLYYRGDTTRYSAVFKDGELVFIPKRRYQLLPHEVLIETVETLIDDGVLVPFKMPAKPWFIPYNDYGVYVNPIPRVPDWGKQLYMNFKYREAQVNGEKVNLGASIYNSVDGTLRLGVRSFAYYPSGSVTVFLMDNIPGQSIVTKYGGKHTGGLEVDPERLVELVKSVMKGGDALLPVFRKWHSEKLTEAIVNEVLEALPVKYVDPFVTLVEDGKGGHQAVLDDNQALSIWQFYQSVSSAVWHSERASFNTRLLLYDKLHDSLMSRRFFDMLVD